VRVHDEVGYLTTMSVENRKALVYWKGAYYAAFIEWHVFLVYDAAHNTLLTVPVTCDV
jgi:hypothetical protein